MFWLFFMFPDVPLTHLCRWHLCSLQVAWDFHLLHMLLHYFIFSWNARTSALFIHEIFLNLLIYIVHLFCHHPYNNIIFTFMLHRVDITGISEDQNLSLEDDNYASIPLSMQEVNPNFASFQGNPFPDPIERCVKYIYTLFVLIFSASNPRWLSVIVVEHI